MIPGSDLAYRAGLSPGRFARTSGPTTPVTSRPWATYSQSEGFRDYLRRRRTHWPGGLLLQLRKMPSGLPERLLHLEPAEALGRRVLGHGLLHAGRRIEPHAPLLLTLTAVQMLNLPALDVSGTLQFDQLFG